MQLLVYITSVYRDECRSMTLCFFFSILASAVHLQHYSPLHCGIYLLSLHWWRVMSCFCPASVLLPAIGGTQGRLCVL